MSIFTGELVSGMSPARTEFDVFSGTPWSINSSAKFEASIIAPEYMVSNSS